MIEIISGSPVSAEPIMYVTYTLTHSKHHFAAADIADGVDYSYFQYMAYPERDQRWPTEFDRLNGAPPFGKGLLKWLKVSPAFLMDKIETPLRIQTLVPRLVAVGLALVFRTDPAWQTGRNDLHPRRSAHSGEALGSHDFATGQCGLVLLLAQRRGRS